MLGEASTVEQAQTMTVEAASDPPAEKSNVFSSPDNWMMLHLAVSFIMIIVSATIQGPADVFRYTWLTSSVVLLIVLALAIYKGGGILKSLEFVRVNPFPAFQLLSVAHILITIAMTISSFTTDVPKLVNPFMWGVSFAVIAIVLAAKKKGYDWVPRDPDKRITLEVPQKPVTDPPNPSTALTV